MDFILASRDVSKLRFAAREIAGKNVDAYCSLCGSSWIKSGVSATDLTLSNFLTETYFTTSGLRIMISLNYAKSASSKSDFLQLLWQILCRKWYGGELFEPKPVSATTLWQRSDRTKSLRLLSFSKTSSALLPALSKANFLSCDYPWAFELGSVATIWLTAYGSCFVLGDLLNRSSFTSWVFVTLLKMKVSFFHIAFLMCFKSASLKT